MKENGLWVYANSSIVIVTEGANRYNDNRKKWSQKL